MRYRPLSATGDYTIGQAWLVNTPACVAQAIETRLRLWLGDWFLDTTDGTPYNTQVLGERYNKAPDAAIKNRILGTPGVTSIVSYSSQFDGNTRIFTVNAQVQTQYSVTPVSVSVPVAVTAP